MERRELIKLSLAAGAAFVLAPAFEFVQDLFASGPPRIDRPWPLDIRPGFRNISNGDSARISVCLNGTKVGAVVAVSPKTGHLLKFKMRPMPEGVYLPGRAQVSTVEHHPRPCDCELRYLSGDGEDMVRCIPLEILSGKVEILTL